MFSIQFPRYSQHSPSSNPSLSIQRTNRRHIPNLNPTPLLPIRIKERRPQPALALRHSQPQPRTHCMKP